TLEQRAVIGGVVDVEEDARVLEVEVDRLRRDGLEDLAQRVPRRSAVDGRERRTREEHGVAAAAAVARDDRAGATLPLPGLGEGADRGDGDRALVDVADDCAVADAAQRL